MSRRTAGWAAPAVCLVALALAASMVQVRSYDFWWHLKAGEIIAGSLSIPRVDDFSFTSAGTPWVDHEWLSQLLIYALFTALGPAGMTALKAVCALAAGGVGYLAMSRSGSVPAVSLAVAAVSIMGLRFRLGERPEALSLPMAAGLAALLLSLAARPQRPARRLAGVGALTALWANLHAASLLSPLMAIACAGGAAADLARSDPDARSSRRASVMVLGAAAGFAIVCLLLNPYGYRALLVPLEISRALEPANLTNPEWLAPAWSSFPLFWVAVLAGGAFVSIRILRREAWSCCRGALWLLAAGLAALSLRNIGLFFAILPIALAGPWRPRAAGWHLPASIAACLAGAAWMALVPPAGAASGVGVQPDRFPDRAADLLEERLHGVPDPRLYNDVAFGGYLVWRGYPGRRVFIDGRNEVHALLLKELSGSIDDGRRWSDLLDRYGIEGAVVAYRSEPVPVRDAITGGMAMSTFSESHFPKSRWALIYWDDVAMIFVLRSGRLAGLASELEYRFARPEAWRLGLPPLPPSSSPDPARQEILRKIAEDPECAVANSAAKVYGLVIPDRQR